MAKQSADYILGSLRNRILLAVAALVVFNSIFGLLGYLAVSFVISEPVYSVVTAVAAMTAATAIFGWWLSNEILRPIEAVSLLARSLERSPSATLPKTTGATETDVLLNSLHRNSQQLQNLIRLMDDVANGKTDSAMAPLQNPDRLSLSFQKLVSKVIESIEAKQQLDELQGSVNRLSSDISGVRSGDLAVDVRGDHGQVGEIAESFKFVLGRLSEIVRGVALGSSLAREAAEDARNIVRTVREAETLRAERLNKTVSVLTDSPERFRELTEQLEVTVSRVAASIRNGDTDPDAQVDAMSRLRGFASESRKRLEQMRERASAIPRAARRTQEIARRANLIALNTTVIGNDQSRDSFLTGEVALLSLKAEAIHKEFLELNESLSADVSRLDNSLAAVWSELNELTGVAGRHAQSASEIEKNVGRMEAIQVSLKTYFAERFAENESVVKALSSNFQSVDCGAQLKLSEHNLDTILNAAATLLDSVSDFSPPPTRAAESVSAAHALPSSDNAPPAEQA